MNQSGNVEVLKAESAADSKESRQNGEQAHAENGQAYAAKNDFQGYAKDQQRNGYGANGPMPAYSSYYQYAGAYYDPFMDVSTPFTTKFPRAKDYSNPQSIAEAFSHLKQVNDPEFDIESISPDAHFYILRSSNDDNIHKAIKYQVWTSTPTGKNILRRAWNDFLEQGKQPEIYLIFSVVSSNQFLGVAKMTSDIDDDESFKYWWEPCKWFGTFQISWHFVKDIHHAKFEHIKEESVNTSVINLKDGTMISAKTGKQMLAVFKSFSNKPSIFDFFDYMDRREDYIRSQRDDNPEFEKYFNECCEAYLENPDNLFPQKRFYNKRSPRKNNNYDNRGGKKYSGNHNGNYSSTNASSNGNYQKSYYNKSEPKEKSTPLVEQFVMITEADKLNKKNKSGKKGKKAGLREDAEFFDASKKFEGDTLQKVEGVQIVTAQ